MINQNPTAITFRKISLLALALFSLLISISLAVLIFFAYRGGTIPNAIMGGFLGLLATAVLSYGFTGHFFRLREVIRDFLVIGGVILSVRSNMRIWQPPATWSELFTLTDFTASLIIVIYFGMIVFYLTNYQRREKTLVGLSFLFAPFLFNWLLILQSPFLIQKIGLFLLFGAKHSSAVFQTLGRMVILLGFNIGITTLISIVITGKLVKDVRVYALVAIGALWCGFSPNIANWGSLSVLDSLPLVLKIAGILTTTMASHAGLWAEVYLLTGITLDAMHSKKPTWYWGSEHFRNGLVKGAIYSGIFMVLVHSTILVTKTYQLRLVFTNYPGLTAIVLGAILFPLLKTVIESFDVSAPFFGRLLANYQIPTQWWRGVVTGGGIYYGIKEGFLTADSMERFGWGLFLGVVAFGGVDLLKDMFEIFEGKRRKLQTWELYGWGGVLGGLIGGALAWYFDDTQIRIVTDKLFRYTTISYLTSGIEVKDYITYPLFNKWGATNLGVVSGGVKLFYCEALAGVVNWAFAAPLFSINLVLLTALLRRSFAPLRNMFSLTGVTEIVKQTVRVLRWGLWMSPIINSFLKIAPDPTWYNQDGAIRTTVATIKSFTLNPEDFRSWSLQVFTNLLVYDWFRVLIWFDHMGLRVATLVNLSFVGGDLIDEKAARSLGYSVRTRWIPEGVRRFATWAPLLIPFFIPRGKEWDIVWSKYESLSKIHPSTTLPPGAALIGIAIFIIFTVVIFLSLQNQLQKRRKISSPDNLLLTNGVYTAKFRTDGRGYSRVFSIIRKGEEIDLSRQPADPLWLCGKFFYLVDQALPQDHPHRIWSLAYNPVGRVGPDYQVTRLGPFSLKISHTFNSILSTTILSVEEEKPVELWQVVLHNLNNRTRILELTSYRELVMNVHGAFWRHPIFNNLHVATWFIRPLNAVIARNRLLKDLRRDSKKRSHSRETVFHAVEESSNSQVTLIGYEDCRPYFIGHQTLCAPEGLNKSLRSPEDEGFLYSFSPIACLRLRIELPPAGKVVIRFIDGYAGNEFQAAQFIVRYLNFPSINGSTLKSSFTKMRSLLSRELEENHEQLRYPHPVKTSLDTGVFAFSEDGTELQMGWNTPRPWAHIIANELGYGTIVANDGDIYSFMGNAQQNGLTPFNFGSTPVQTPGQVLYLFNPVTGEIDTPSYAPLRQKDAQYRITFGRGYACFRKVRGNIDIDYSIAVLPDYPAEIRLLTIRNRGTETVTYRIVPYFQIMLGEEPFDTCGKIKTSTDRELSAVFFTNPANEFHKGWGFVATNLPVEIFETIRKRFIGGPERNLSLPFMVEHGQPDDQQEDDGYRAAAFISSLAVPPGGEKTMTIMVGQTDSKEQAEELIRHFRETSTVQEAFEKTKLWWSEKLSRLRVKTNEPAFDRLVNDWLPYQIFVSHLWGRIGLCQRSGAYGFRDQIQDVLPFLFLYPDLCRKLILLHAQQQFREGDVLQWWHQSWEGKTGWGLRGRASDPHLWLPYVVYHYVKATGDNAILEEKVPFLESREIPPGKNEVFSAHRSTREKASLYEHCLRAINFSLGRLGPHGLPLIGTGDWNDGLNQIGPRGKGESVWLGFFLYDILVQFTQEVVELKRDQTTRERFLKSAQNLKTALTQMWRSDHYIRAITDDGRELDIFDALTVAWPVIAGIAELEQGTIAIEAGLRVLEKDNLVLLCSPPFTESSEPYPGRIADYPPGVRENGGQYSHGASWLVDGLLKLADLAELRGEVERVKWFRSKAVELWFKISPIMHMHSRVYGLSPHQQAADIYYGPGYEGRGGWSWYTGSAGRMLYTAYHLLGLKMEKGKLTIAKDAFEPRGNLRLIKVVYQGKESTDS